MQIKHEENPEHIFVTLMFINLWLYASHCGLAGMPPVTWGLRGSDKWTILLDVVQH